MTTIPRAGAEAALRDLAARSLRQYRRDRHQSRQQLSSTEARVSRALRIQIHRIIRDATAR